MSVLLGSDPLTIALGAAFGLAGLAYWWWVLGGAERLSDLRSFRILTHTNRLFGRSGARDPADDLEQALNDALRGAPEPGDLRPPGVRPLDGASRPPDPQA